MIFYYYDQLVKFHELLVDLDNLFGYMLDILVLVEQFQL